MRKRKSDTRKMQYYRTIGNSEHEKLIRGEVIYPINKWEHAKNNFPKDLQGVYLYIRDTDGFMKNAFYNFMGGEYIVILDLPDDRIIARGNGWYASNIPDEDGCYGLTTEVDEVMTASYSMSDVIKIISVKNECYDGDDFYWLR